MKHLNNKGAQKPLVIVLLVVITLVVTLTISFWMGGLTSQFTRREQVEIIDAYSFRLEDGGWTIMVESKNKGNVDASLDILRMNGKDISDYGNNAVTVNTGLPIVIQMGSYKTVEITIRKGTVGFITGGTIDLVLGSSVSGLQYPKQVMLQ